MIAVDSNAAVPLMSRIGINANVTYAVDEESLVKEVVALVRQWDPDIVAGYEVIYYFNFFHSTSNVEFPFVPL